MFAVEINDVSFSYDGKNNVLHNVSFSIEAGNYIAIVGHNGSGKSTLSKLILGLLEAKQGTIRVFGQELNEKTVRQIRQQVGIVFQNPDNQFIGSTVRDDIAFGLENRCIPHEEMESLITYYAQKVNMLEHLDKEPSHLSGGQKQRVAIAGVLAMHPQMMIFDEATVMLDPKGRKEMDTLVQEMRKEHPDLTILSITHDIEEASRADKVIIMDQGKIFAYGSPKEVLSDEKMLKDIDLKMPFLMELSAALQKQGISVDSHASFDEMVVSVCPSD